MWISREARECLSSNAQGDRIFRTEGDGDQWFCALLRTRAGEIVSKGAEPAARGEQALADRNRRQEEDSLGCERKQKSRTERLNVRGAVQRARVFVARRACVYGGSWVVQEGVWR